MSRTRFVLLKATSSAERAQRPPGPGDLPPLAPPGQLATSKVARLNDQRNRASCKAPLLVRLIAFNGRRSLGPNLMLGWRRVLGIVPVPIFYTDRLPHGVGARVAWYAPIVSIRPKYHGDEGLHRHELEHVRQWWTCFAAMGAITTLALLVILPVVGHPMPQESLMLALWLSWLAHPLLHTLSRPYRTIAEIYAFRKQMMYANRHGEPLSREEAGARLASSRYMLQIGQTEARQLLG